MDVRLHFPTRSAGNALTHLPRCLVGKWGMDYKAKGNEPRNAVSAAANGRGGRR